MKNGVNCKVLESGALLVTCDNETRAYIKEHMPENYWGTLADIFESYLTNGSFEPFDAGQGNPFVGLTSAPCIAESLTVEDDGTRVIDGRFWWFPNYCLDDPLEQLKRHGRTVFAYGGKGRES